MEWVAEDVEAATYIRDGEILKESFSALIDLKQASFIEETIFGENSARMGVGTSGLCHSREVLRTYRTDFWDSA